MELLIAVLIAFGVITSEQKGDLDQAKAEELIEMNGITKQDIEKEAKIIGLEETDF